MFTSRIEQANSAAGMEPKISSPDSDSHILVITSKVVHSRTRDDRLVEARYINPPLSHDFTRSMPSSSPRFAPPPAPAVHQISFWCWTDSGRGYLCVGGFWLQPTTFQSVGRRLTISASALLRNLASLYKGYN